jgi:hypothetical protein
MLTVPGTVLAQVELTAGAKSMATFTFHVEVQPDPSVGAMESKDYYNLSKYVSQEVKRILGDFDFDVDLSEYAKKDEMQAQIGDLSQLSTKDKSNLVAAINEAAKSGDNSSQNAGLTTAQINALDGMFQVAAYDASKDFASAYAAFKTAFGITDSGDTGDDGEESPDEAEKTLTSITVAYSGGNVAVGTELSALSGIVVTATYSDGATEAVTDYTLSGEIVDGENTITVTYEGLTATFTVTGIAAEEAVTYAVSWERYDDNTDISNTATSVVEGQPYYATIVGKNGHVPHTVTVTMGGDDISATAYADGVVSIESVTGDIVITVWTALAEPEAGKTEFTNLLNGDTWAYTTEEQQANGLPYGQITHTTSVQLAAGTYYLYDTHKTYGGSPPGVYVENDDGTFSGLGNNVTVTDNNSLYTNGVYDIYNNEKKVRYTVADGVYFLEYKIVLAVGAKVRFCVSNGSRVTTYPDWTFLLDEQYNPWKDTLNFTNGGAA